MYQFFEITSDDTMANEIDISSVQLFADDNNNLLTESSELYEIHPIYATNNFDFLFIDIEYFDISPGREMIKEITIQGRYFNFHRTISPVIPWSRLSRIEQNNVRAQQGSRFNMRYERGDVTLPNLIDFLLPKVYDKICVFTTNEKISTFKKYILNLPCSFALRPIIPEYIYKAVFEGNFSPNHCDKHQQLMDETGQTIHSACTRETVSYKKTKLIKQREPK